MINQNTRPIYAGKRTFIGKKDLVVSFYTKRCRHQCAFCAIPSRSSRVDVPAADINAQIDWIFNKYNSEIDTFEQFSVGNEGSILDEVTFPRKSMNYLIDKINQTERADVLSLETRPEYINRDRLTNIIERFKGSIVDVTVGFETQDDYLRNTVLKKDLSKKKFESTVSLLGDLGVRLTSYVMLKPAPSMKEYEGIKEAKATVQYLVDLTECEGVELIIYLTPTYIPKDAPLTTQMLEKEYKPPAMSSARSIAQLCSKLNVPMYISLWSEGLAESEAVPKKWEARARGTLKLFNRNNDPSLVYSTLM